MTKGAWMCRQQDNGLKIWYVPRQNDKPCTDSERAQKWRLSLASLLFFTVLLSDHLWLCAEANLTRSRDQQQNTSAEPTGGNHSLSPIFSRADQARSTISSEKRAFFLGNATTRPICQLEPCSSHYLSEQCVSIEDAESVCGSVSEQASDGSPPPSFNNFHLPFCESYTLSELFAGMSRPEGSNCDLSLVQDGDATVCVQCVEIYQRLDQHAQEKYEEFQSLFQKYLQSGEYSVKSCIDDCKTVYKAWLCSQYFEASQFHCSSRIPCKQYCSEVQTRCPFVLPDNKDLVYGGLPSFLCAGLPNNHPTNADPECCDVRWETHNAASNKQSKGARGTTKPVLCHRSSLTSSAASRLCNTRLKLCVLVLILLHTVVTVSATQTSTGLGSGGLAAWEDNSTNDE
ncbi:NALCN channel auxiliary factor 1 [Pristis pectinata]|uniref:NALCN channel auxiliary factor 1 n=1 Tax=Pristis pectinata TaxID=685728 RepID=UPI00223CB9A3|nr:NALCN channel auxiliary factor 1 [Pristis pectinata]